MTYKGRTSLNTDFGATFSLLIRGIIGLYALYLTSKMAVYDLDTITQYSTKHNQSADGVLNVRPAEAIVIESPDETTGDARRLNSLSPDALVEAEEALAEDVDQQNFGFAIAFSQAPDPTIFEVVGLSRNHYGDEFDLPVNLCEDTDPDY